MKPTTHSSIEEYRRQLDRCAEAMAIARNADVSDFLPAGDSPDLVDLFTDGNIDKRYDKLRDQLELLSDIPDLDARIENYIRSVPLAAYATGASDADQFLGWLERLHSFTQEEQDLVTCQQARYEVETAAAKLRAQHVRFQDLCSVSDELQLDFGADDAIRIEVNPVHQMARFQTSVLFGGDDEIELPVHAVFYPVGIDVRTAILEGVGLWLVNELSNSGPRSPADLIPHFPGGWQELLEVCGDLVDAKMAAYS